MATATARLRVDVNARTSGLSQANREVGAFGRGMGKLGGVAKVAGGVAFAAAGVAAIKFGKDAISAASDLQQSQGAVQSVFKSQAKAVTDFSKTSADRLGLARSEYLQLAAVTGAQLKGMGIPLKDTAKLTDTLTTRAADMASTFGGTTAEAMSAIGSLMRGERDPIEKYGVSLKQTDINARLAAKGQDKLKGSALTQAQAQAGLDLLLQKTSDTQGQFAREADTMAGAQQRASAKFKDAQATIGTALLPMVTRLYNMVSTYLVPALLAAGKWISTNVVPAFKLMGQWIMTNVVPAVTRIWNLLYAQLMPTFRGLWSTLQTQIIPTLRILWTWFQKYLWPILKVVGGIAIMALINNFKVGVAIFRIAAAVIATLVRWLKNTFAWIGNVINVIRRLSARNIQIITSAFRNVWQWAKNAYTWVRNVAGAVVRFSAGAINTVWQAIQKVYNWAKSAYGWVKNLLANLGNSGAGFLSQAINAVTTLIGWVKDAVDWVSNLGKKIAGKAWSVVKKVVPGLRYGGMSHGGTYLVGERGPELLTLPYRSKVTNAQRTEQVMASRGGGGGGAVQPLTLNLALDLGADTITRTVQLEVQRNDVQLIRALRARRA